MQTLLMYSLCFASAALMGVASYSPVAQRIRSYLDRRSTEAGEQLENMFMNLSRHRIRLAYAVSPVVVGGLAWLLTEQWLCGLVGLAFGVLVPKVLVVNMDRVRRNKFHNQLIDGLLLLTSSLKAGLSMMQAFTVLAEEMPQPISQEFGLLLKETKMGVDMMEAMERLKQRMPSDDTSLFVTAVLVARETGGDITHIFSRLVETLRERKKIKERVKTLTFMARMQAFIMGMLPFAFGWLVYQMDHSYFTFFIKDEMGRVLLTAIVVLQIIGALLFFRFSRSPI